MSVGELTPANLPTIGNEARGLLLREVDWLGSARRAAVANRVTLDPARPRSFLPGV